MIGKPTILKTRSIALAVAFCCLPLLGGCALGERGRQSLHKYWIEETEITPGPVKRKNLELTSSDPQDYIFSDGTGIAIPAKQAEDLYISPFAPTKGYVLSKGKPGSWILCPYTGKPLTLGDRDKIGEKELL